MTPALLSLMSAFAAFLGGGLSAGPDGGRWWRGGAGIAVAGLALALALGPGGGLGQDLAAPARSVQGAAVHARVVIQRPGARRQVRQVPLQRPVQGSGLALLVMAAAGVLGAGLASRGAKDRASLVGAVLPLAGSAFALATLAGGGGTGQGEPGVRAFLQGFDLAAAHVTGFTIPDGVWHYEVPGLVAVGVVCAASLVAGLSAVRPMPARAVALWPALGALAALAAMAWQIAWVGGAPWRPAELAQGLTAAVLGLAWLHADAPRRGASLTALGLLLAALAVGLGAGHA
ncbi:MAG: hypothetical protein KC613_06115 [Myxococcales bacterium]|nr:hypothetical protein [Myxococcales bacterium]MCB9526476.1 hypothetical protein [Myxococcales bacterium]